MSSLKRRYNNWLFEKYGYERGPLFDKIPIRYKLCPLWSPSLYSVAECNGFSKGFMQGLKEAEEKSGKEEEIE